MGWSKNGVLAIGAVFGLLPIIVVSLRFVARQLTRQKPGTDDWLIVVALVFNVAVAITLVIMAAIGGLGEDQLLDENGQQYHYEGLYHYEKCRYTIQVCSTVAIGFAKLSILFLYRRIFSTSVFRKINTVYIVIIIAWLIAFLTATLFQCTPVSTIWESFENEYGSRCIRVIPFYYSLAITDTVTDFCILVLPLPVIWKLQLSLRKRLGLLAVFILGGSVVGVTLVRLVVYLQAGKQLVKQYDNVIMVTTGVFAWSLIESSLSVVSTSLATLGPILWRSSRFGMRGSGRKGPMGYDSSSGSRTFGANKNRRTLGQDLENISDGESQIELRPGNVAEATATKSDAVKDTSGIWVRTDFSTTRY